MRRSDSILQQFYMSKLPKAQTGGKTIADLAREARAQNVSRGDMQSYYPQIQRMKQQVEIDRLKEENIRLARQRAAAERQGSIKAAPPKRSAVSKAWAVATNPMTALSYKMPYWSSGRSAPDLPDYFERGDREGLDMAGDILNPFGYVNAAKNALQGIGRVAMAPSTALEEAPGIGLNTLQALPVIGNIGMFSEFISPSLKAAKTAFKATSDLPLNIRLRNAANAGALKIPMKGDVYTHSYFNMTPDEAKATMAAEMINLPKGALSIEKSMSKNSAPLFWSQAARAPKDFRFVRTGETQPLNWAGTQGKRVISALPEGYDKYMPEINDIRSSIQERISYLRQAGGDRNIALADRLEKEGLASAIIAEMPYAAYNDQNTLDAFLQFMKNYKPVLDKPIEAVNLKTGLNFPRTKIVRSTDEDWYNRIGPSLSYTQPTIAAVKGDPLYRYYKGITDFAKERARKLYLGDSFNSGADDIYYNFRDISTPKVRDNMKYASRPSEGAGSNFVELYSNGGPIISSRGQWAYPGINTIVPTPTGQITMQDVPYPVYGQDETGYGQMMYPGGEYTFPGQMVNEIPMMAGGGQHGGLDRWFAEKWVDVKTGKACGRQEEESRKGYPACRPSRRISSETPKTSSEMSPAEKAKFKRSKTSSQRINYNHERKQWGGMSSADSVRNQAEKILQYEQLRGGPGGTPLPYYSDPSYMKMLMGDIYPQVKRILPNASAMEASEAMDFIFNAGWDKAGKKITKDPRAYALQEYYRQYDPSKLDTQGNWSGRKNPAYSFDQEYNSTIGKLSENQRRVLMNRGRDWYYKNINNPSPGVPNPNYYDTWYGRIWNTNDFLPFNPNNPNFKYKK